MSLQEMQLFQEKHEFARPDDIVGTDQPRTASVGMHQGNARDLPDDTQRWVSNHPGGIHQQEREYKLSQIKDKRQRLYSRILRKSGAIEDLFYSSKNKVAVEEELTQFNDILKLVVAVHEECKQYMEEEEINNSEEWLDELDEIIFNFKGKVHSWLKKTNEPDRSSKASSRQRVVQVDLQEEVQNRTVKVAPSQRGQKEN